jgi:transglutaminase-like putative cysteine protease
MSAGAIGPAGPATISVGARFQRTDTRPNRRPSPLVTHAIRLLSFAALGAYGVIRWATLVQPAPLARLVGLLGLAVVTAAVIPLLRRFGPPPAILAAVGLCLLALPIAGLNWHDFLQLRIAVGARAVGDGLSGLPGSLVPYVGISHTIPLVITLGAAVLLLDAAIVLAFAPVALTDARRAGAALPLIALAVVPCTLLRPELPYLQGLILFGLLAAFIWGERAQLAGRRAAIVLLGAAGLAGAAIAPRIDAHHAWLDYRSWTGTLAHAHLEQFTWNQQYGPLHWPRDGHIVFTVKAKRPDYWKAEDLDAFDGYGWVSAPVGAAPLPNPSAASLARWTQPITVSITGLRSTAVIGSGSSGAPTLAQGVFPGNGAGTWISYRPLTPGARYRVSTYSPHPSAAQLRDDRGRYPAQAVLPYLSVSVPAVGAATTSRTELQFPQFRAHGRGAAPPAELASSPYANVYALARQLIAGAATPYDYALAIERYLTAHEAYNENPPARRYPLVSFLFKDRIGYCQQFSGAMALLLRMGGVPARVAAGFTSGTLDGHGRFAVSDIDAHAWVEAWFPRYGWVRFDPTPAVAPARGGNTALPVSKSLPGTPTSGIAPRRSQGATSLATTGATHHAAGHSAPWLLLPAAILFLIAGLSTAALLRPEPSPEQQLAELERALARTGRPVGPGLTLAVLEHRFREVPAAAAYIRGLRLGRYAGSEPGRVPGGRRALREELRRGLGLSGRIRALWALPPRPRPRRRARRAAGKAAD